MQIRKNLFYVSGGTYGKLGNAYVLKYSNGYILIDSSNPEALETIRTNLEYWNIPEDQITHVLLTHGHDDHAGCSRYFQKQGAKVFVGEPDSKMVEQGNFGSESPFINHTLPPCIPDCLFEDNKLITIGNLQIHVYLTPGHTDGSVIFVVKLDNDTVLFSGDMFFPDGEKGDLAYTGWKGDLNYNAIALGESFSNLWKLNLEPTVILGGHGIPRIGPDAKEIIRTAYKYYLTNNR